AVRAAPLARMALAQHRETVTLAASRGTIFDRTGVQLGIGEQATTVFANPRQIADPHRVAALAQDAFGRDVVKAEQLLPRLADRTHGFVYVCRKSDPSRAAALMPQH